ncbi:MAG: Presenilin [Promethearchaeota archaeon]|nr:MAG: Presenilin [Candidatus Lokiarchaeota archaeon]
MTSNLNEKDENVPHSSDEASEQGDSEKEKVEKDFIPHFFPTITVNRNLYPIPILIAIICAGILTYLTDAVAGVQIEGGYFSEAEYGATAGLLNGLIFTVVAVASAFVIIFIVKRKGINVLKYIFGLSIGFLIILQSLFFGEIILYLIFVSIQPFENIQVIYNIVYYSMLVGIIVISIFMMYKYFSTESLIIKNSVVLYVGLLTGALLGIMMPLWTTIAILIGISLWDIFAVLYKKGPIKQMIDLASGISDEEIEEKIKSGEIDYDTSKLELGIGDLVFYSMLTSASLILTGNLIIVLLTTLAIVIGTGITIQGLKRNKILPGLPISIFLGLGTFLISWAVLVYLL